MNEKHDTTDHQIFRAVGLEDLDLTKPSFQRFQQQLEADLELLVQRWSSKAAPWAARTSAPIIR